MVEATVTKTPLYINERRDSKMRHRSKRSAKREAKREKKRRSR